MSPKSSNRFIPLIIAVSVVIGILIGTFYAQHFAGNRLGIINGRFSFATTVGLFSSVVGFTLLFLADRAAKLMGEDGIF